jgi:signal recognition particle GTPase
MFDSLVDKMSEAFKKFKSKGKLTEDDLAEIETAIESKNEVLKAEESEV